MSLTDGTGLSATDIMALTGNNDGFGNGGVGGWWIILFILLLCGGFGNNRWNGGASDSGMASMAIPYMLGNQGSNADVQRGFDQQAIMTAITNLGSVMNQGFSSAAIDSCNKAMANMQAINALGAQASNDKFDTISTLNNGHNTILQQMGTYEMARQNCCCENKQLISDLKATILAENCADRTALDQSTTTILQAMNAGFQGIKDQMVNDKLDAKNERILALERELNNANTKAAIFANNQSQTDQIMSYLNPPYARPFPPNNGCNNGWNNNCPGNM